MAARRLEKISTRWLRTAALALVTTVLFTGCGKYYYGKPGAATWDWGADHTACLREVGALTENKQYAVVAANPYRACMLAKGWTREQRLEGQWGAWFRGVEDDGTVEIMGSTTAPAGSASRELACRRAYIERSGWESRLDQYHACVRQ